MQTRFNIDKVTPAHVDEICKLITNHFCIIPEEILEDHKRLGLKENGFCNYHKGISYRDENYKDVLRSFDPKGNMIFQARTQKPSKYITFIYQGVRNGSNHSCSICIDWDGRFTYGGGGHHSIEIEETLSSIPFLIEFVEYIKWIDVLYENYED